MNRPYIVCHMMTAIDGRIDCAMTEKLPGVKEYYETLGALDAPTTLSGRVTAQREMAEPGRFAPKNAEPLGKEAFSKKSQAPAYEVVVDTQGSLLWPDLSGSEKPLLVVTSQQVTKEYLEYLDARHISWIACGSGKVDLARAAELLQSAFGVARLAVVGGGTINAAFLAAGLLDELSLLLAPGIDGRKGMAAVFDGLAAETEPFVLQLEAVTKYEDGALWLRYTPSRK